MSVLIIRRYLSRQVMSTTIAITVILTVIMLGGRLVKYFGLAAAGKLDLSVLLSIIGFRIPGFLTLILPLGFFAGMLLVFSRLYVDHEMDVLNSSGVSRERLGLMLWPMVVLMVLAELGLSLWAGPWGEQQSDQMFAAQAVRSGFDLVKSGEFVSSGAYTIYVKAISRDRQTLDDVFVYQRGATADKPDVLITAKHARRVVDAAQESSIVDLSAGQRYELHAGGQQYTRAAFAYYRLVIAHDSSVADDTGKLELDSLNHLLPMLKASAPARAELGWRISIGLSLLVAVVLALPLSKVSPRQGRFYRLLPAVLLFVSLVVALMSMKNKVAKGSLSVYINAYILLGYGLFGLFLIRTEQFSLKDWLTKKSSTSDGSPPEVKV